MSKMLKLPPTFIPCPVSVTPSEEVSTIKVLCCDPDERKCVEEIVSKVESEKSESDTVDDDQKSLELNVNVGEDDDDDDTLQIQMQQPTDSQTLYQTLTMKELRKHCKDLGLSQVGKKAELVERITENHDDDTIVFE